MNAWIALIRKDLVLYFSNRRALIMSVAAPIAIAAFFGYLFNPGTQKPSRIPVAIVDLDASPTTRKIVTALGTDATLDLRETAEAAGLEQVRLGNVRAAIIVPAGFGEQASRALLRGTERPVIAIHYDPSQAMALAVVRGLLAQHVMQTVAATTFGGFSDPAMSLKLLGEARADVLKSERMSPAERSDLVAMLDSVQRIQQRQLDPAPAAGTRAGSAPGFNIPYETREQEVRAKVDRKYNSYAHSFAGMGVQFILFMGIELGVGLLQARRLGLWKRLRAAPVSRSLLLGTRIASGAMIATILLGIIFAAAIAFFGVRIEGSVVGFAGVAIAFAFLTATFGLLIAALGRTPEATRGLAIFATLVMVMLGGAWAPTFIFPEWLQTLSLGVPTRWAVDGLDAMTWRGLGLGAALAPIGVMLAFSAAFAAIAVARFDWEE
jgi:ABC-2 type transport system permease protein